MGSGDLGPPGIRIHHSRLSGNRAQDRVKFNLMSAESQQPCPSGPLPIDERNPLAPNDTTPSGGPFSEQRQEAQANRRRIENRKATKDKQLGGPANPQTGGPKY